MARGGARKVSREEVAERMAWMERRIDGRPGSYGRAVRAFALKFNTTERCAEIYVARVRERWRKEADATERADVRIEIDRALNRVVNGALRDGKYAAATGALRTKMVLHGLDESTADEQLDDGVDALTAKLAARGAAEPRGDSDPARAIASEPEGTGDDRAPGAH